ncbi:MAG: phosphatase PAP2 family protein, partial [Gemmatimonadota bacterium]
MAVSGASPARAAQGGAGYTAGTGAGPAHRPRPHEILAAGYFALTGLFVVAYGSPMSVWWDALLLRAALIALCLAGLPRLPDRGAWRLLRDWLPPIGLVYVYAEVGRLNDLFTEGYHDAAILRLEAGVFGTQPSVVLRELFPWKPLSEYLHLAYFSYYALGPAYAGSLYLQRRYAAYRYSLTVMLAIFFVCYLAFVMVPVAGPWYVFARPSPDEMGWLFPHVEHAVLASAATVGAAFPSSHVAAALGLWLLAWRLSRPVFRVFAFFVPALIVGTVYGGFHYGVDALAGIVAA